jgi:hypothetical protein
MQQMTGMPAFRRQPQRVLGRRDMPDIGGTPVFKDPPP